MGIIAGVPNMRDVEYFETSAVLITAVLLGKYRLWNCGYYYARPMSVIDLWSNYEASYSCLKRIPTALHTYLGKYLEVYAKGQTAAAIHKLSKLKASSARLVRSGTSGNSVASGSAGEIGSEGGAGGNEVGGLVDVVGVGGVGSVDYGKTELARCGSSDSFL